MKLTDIKIDKKDPKTIVLAVLIVIFIISFYRYFVAKSIETIAAVQPGNQKIAAVSDQYFNIEVLKANQDTAGGKGRDLFSYSQCQSSTPPPPPPPPPVEVKIEQDPQIEQPPAQPVAQEPPQMATIKIFGVLNRDGKDLYAFLSDGKEIYVVRENEIFANQFRITHLDDEKVEISTIKGDFKKTLTISGG
jgi:type IV secretory pathway VirB10-like protein